LFVLFHAIYPPLFEGLSPFLSSSLIMSKSNPLAYFVPFHLTLCRAHRLKTAHVTRPAKDMWRRT